MKIKEQNSSRVKFSPYLNQSWFDSPVLLEYSEATCSGFAASLSSTCFDSPCFLVRWDLISNLLPPMKINQLWFVVSFILAPWTLSCTFACLCSSLSSQLPWLLVARSPHRQWKSCRRRTSGFRKITISSAQRRRMTSSPVALKLRFVSTF